MIILKEDQSSKPCIMLVVDIYDKFQCLVPADASIFSKNKIILHTKI